MVVNRAPTQLSLSPLDNRALANLCGPLDANLRQIETALDVTRERKGISAGTGLLFEIMGDKITAKKTAVELGIPVVPGSAGAVEANIPINVTTCKYWLQQSRVGRRTYPRRRRTAARTPRCR